MQQTSVLVVEDDEIAARAIGRRLVSKRNAAVVLAFTATAALAELDARHFDLVIADVGLPDLSGIDLLIMAREKRPLAYSAVLTGEFDRDLVHRVGLLGAYFMSKPAPTNVLEEAVLRAERRRAARMALPEYVAHRAAAWKLSPKQHAILLWLAKLQSRDSYCATFGVKPSTFDTQVKRLRAKIPGHDSIDVVVHRLLLDLIEARASNL